MSSKYSKEFKLKVLEYYFEHGGDKKFGNKARTASHFCIDHKTVTRMLCNPEMVKKARKTLGGKKSVGTENAKSSKPNIKNGQPFVSIEKFISPQQKNQSSSSSSSKSSQSSKKINSSPRTTSEVPIIELPEDPDFSVLKSSIDTSVSSVSHVARLLVTATAEVKYLLANECDLIFECKVCRNLFRSVINFLAHKRNYCDEKYINVKNMFHKDTHSNMTTESSTAFVEPEPPPTHVEGESSPSDFPEALENTEVDKTPLRKIDKIASNLVKKKEKVVLTSSPTNKGSSEYYKSIENVNNARKSVGTDCTVVLKDIKDVSGAVYQSVASRNEVPVSPKKTSRQRKRDRPIHLDSKGKVVEKKDDIIKAPLPLAVQEKVSVPVIEKMEEMEVDVSCNSCNSIFSSKKLLNAHIEETHGLERMVYTCPICNVIFLSIWGCVKHLVRVHKKKRHHRDRLKHVICSRAYKKVFTPKEIAKHSHKSCSQISKSHDNKVEDISGETSSPLCVVKDELEKVDSLEKTKEGNNSRIPVPGADEESPGFFRNKAPVLPNTCPRCFQAFPTPTAMGSHLQLCSFTPLSSSSETPEKKIAIQIRKDYQKDSMALASPTLKESGSVSHALVTGKEELYEESRNKKDDGVLKKKIQERLNELCLVNSLTCIPCDKKYNTIHVLKRHVSTHMGWSRFSCSECSFRHYERYVCIEHCVSVHKCRDKEADKLVIKEERIEDPKDKEIGRVPSATNGLGRKINNLQNGDYTSSECSASIVSEDSLSVKSEFDSQETERADVVYRELIEKTDDVLTEINSIENKSENLEPEESKTTLKNALEKKESEIKIERPQRNRKIIEQKDFVYEPLRSPSVSFRPDENKIEASTLVIPRQRISSGQTVILKIDRSTKRKEFPTSTGESTNKKTCARVLADTNPHFSVCNGQGDNGTVFARTTVTSPKASTDISVNKEPIESMNPTPIKLNSSEQPVLSNRDQVPVEMKIQFRTTGVKIKDSSDHGNKNDSISPVRCQISSDNSIRVKTLANVAKESLANEKRSVVLKKLEDDNSKAVIKNLQESDANENIVPVKEDLRPMNVEHLISRLKKRIGQTTAENNINSPKREVSVPTPDKCVDKDTANTQKVAIADPLSNQKVAVVDQVSSQKKLTIVDPVSNQKKVTILDSSNKSISVIQIQKPKIDRKRTISLSQPISPTSVMTLTTSVASTPTPTPSTSQPESKIKITVESKQQHEINKNLNTKGERPPRKKSLDSKD